MLEIKSFQLFQFRDDLAKFSKFYHFPKESAYFSRFAFNIYDIDNDGFISNGELFTVLKIMVGENLDDINLQQIVDKTIVYADEDGDGKLSFEEFKKVIDKLNITERMTIEQIHQESSGNESEENEHTSRGDDNSDEESEDHDSNRECVAARVVNKVRNVD